MLTKNNIYIFEIDPNEFDEYIKGKYKYKNCRKYLKKIEWKCIHTETCKTKYKFKIKIYNQVEKAEIYFENEDIEEEE